MHTTLKQQNLQNLLSHAELIFYKRVIEEEKKTSNDKMKWWWWGAFCI